MFLNLAIFIVLSNIPLIISQNIGNITSTVSVQSANQHSDSLLGLGTILNIDIGYIIIAVLCGSICFVGCCSLYFFAKAHQNKKEFTKSVDAISKTVEPTVHDTNRKFSADIIYNDENNYNTNNPNVSNQTCSSSQTLPNLYTPHSAPNPNINPFYTQNNGYRSHYVQNKPIHMPPFDQQSLQQSSSSQRSVQSQSSNPTVHYGISYQNYGPQRYPVPYQPQPVQQHPITDVYTQHSTHSQQHVQQRVDRSIPPPPPLPPLQNIKPIQILVTSPKHLRPADSPLSDGTTPTTESRNSDSGSYSSSQSSASESEDDEDPPTPDTNIEPEQHSGNIASDLQVKQSNMLSQVMMNDNNGDMLESMSKLLEFQQIDCGDVDSAQTTDTPISTTTLVLRNVASETIIDTPVETPVISSDNTPTDITNTSANDIFPQTRGRLIVLD